MARPVGEKSVVVSGIGQSEVGRRLFEDPLKLTLDACLEAIEDAGLKREDIDGLATYPGAGIGTKGFSGPGVTEVHDALRLPLNWYAGGHESPGQFGSILNACAAVASGMARHVLCFRTVFEGSAQGKGGRKGIGGGSSEAPDRKSAPPKGEAGKDGAHKDKSKSRAGGKPFRAQGSLQWTLPFGASSAANWLALNAQRHFHEFGTTREQLAQIALNARKNAALNPKAVYRDPLSMDEYLSARMISTPLCLYDCDVPADGSTAVIISHVDTAPDLKSAAVHVEAVGSALHGRPSWDQFDDLTTMAARDAAKMLWSRTDLTPDDVRVAELYDGFSFLTLAWLEALGFCARGEGGSFVEGGTRIARDGQLALNTQGGQLSGGRLHGYGMLHEAVLQLRGGAGERQVPGAPRVALAAAGGGPLGACMLLRTTD